MNGLKAISVSIEVRVPKGQFCNHTARGRLAPDPNNCCRFCVRNNQGGFTCALYNELLTSQAQNKVHSTKGKYRTNLIGVIVNKHSRCAKATAYGKDVITDETEELVRNALEGMDINELKVDAIKQYQSVYKGLLAYGLPVEMAEREAMKAIKGGTS